MTFVLKSAVSALALSCGLAVMSAAPAHAYTLMDMLRGDRQRTQSTIFMDQMPPGRVGQRGGIGGSLGGLDPEAPLPKVSGPRYYTYKTETLQFVDAGKFADPVVTGAVADVSGSGDASAEPAVQRRFPAQAKVRANADAAKALEAYYGDSRNPLVWVEGNQINDRAKSAMSVLADAAVVGLDPADYAVQTPDIDPANPDPAFRDRALTQFELELSAKVLAFVQDTVRGRIDPNKISGYHDFQRKVVNLAPVLKLARMSPDVGAYIASRSPDSPQFLALKAELAKLRAADGGNEERIVVSLDNLLRPGDSSPEIANIVKAIGKHGSETLRTDHAATLAAYAGSSDYSPDIVSLVEDFQKERGLKSDGVIGQATVRAMTGGDTNASKIDKLVVAMEQARWLPEDLGSRYVMINQPAYMVYYHNDGKEQLSMRVVVGGKNNQTYFFDDEIETVEFNPFWGVPQSIIINEMLPKLRSDPNYLDQLGYEVEVNGHAVASSSVDWYGSTDNVSVRQPPSSDNALGELEDPVPEQPRDLHARHAVEELLQARHAGAEPRLRAPCRSACDGGCRAQHDGRRCRQTDRQRAEPCGARAAEDPGLRLLLHGLAEQGRRGGIF